MNQTGVLASLGKRMVPGRGWDSISPPSAPDDQDRDVYKLC